MAHEEDDPPLEKRQPPPEAWRPARSAAKAVLEPLERFLHVEASSGLVLMVMAVIAMIWANSPFAESYHHLFHTNVTIGFGDFLFEKDLHFWINDGLMVIFFFVVGLEIRREMHAGELSELKRASLPVAAALGGMILPAVIYLAFSSDEPEARRGWGVPMATDIAFAVGVLALLGKRVPAALRVLLLALAIIDDIGAILVIALFYSEGIQLLGIALAAGGVLLVVVMQRIGIRLPILYVAPGAVIWAGMLSGGVHPTIAGVIIGLLTPVRSWFGEKGFLEEATRAIREFKERLSEEEQLAPLGRLEVARREAIPPVLRLQSILHPYVAFLIMPIFALANAGVSVGEVDLSADTMPVALGVGVGLVAGKTIGILGASMLAVQSGLSTLPRGVDWRGLLIVGLVGGIGFTMALFIAALAFAGDPTLLGVSKLAVLIGSTTAGVLGLALGFWLLPKQGAEGAAQTVGEAERSTEA